MKSHIVYSQRWGVQTIRNKSGFLYIGLFLALILFALLSLRGVLAAPTTTITGNTSASENQPGWMFGRDLSTSTPFEFNTDKASIGNGSLYVPPIGAPASNKFIGEYFMPGTLISDLDSFSVDYLTATSASDAQQFYLTVYANFGSSSPTKFYDCRYNAVATVGSTSAFNTLTFTPDMTFSGIQVTTRGGGDPSPYACPAKPSDMNTLVANSTIRMISINVGDTTASDVGVAGYFDNVVLNKTSGSTIFDFEYSPDPTNSHQLNISGDAYRDVALNDCDNKSECENKAENLAGWEMRLYKEDGASWVLASSDTTDASGIYKFATQHEASTYHVCEVVKPGWTQPIQTWSGSGYKVDTPNLSGNSSEGPYCTTTTYDDTADRSSKSHFGNVDTKKPFTEVLSPAENGVHTSTLNINIRSTDNESGIVKAVANLYGSSGLLSTCVNETVSPAEAQHDFTCVVAIDSLADGDYYIKTNAKDAGGLLSNTVTWNFKVDNTTPAVPVLVSPANNSVVNASSPIANDWSNITDAEHYIYQSYNVNGSGDCNLSSIRFTGNYTDSQTNSRTIADGLKFCWRVKAVDVAGNESAWSDLWKVTIDNTAPTTPVNGLPNGTYEPDNEFDFTWDASTDNVGPVSYEYQATQNSAQSGGVLTTGLWSSGTLSTNMIHSSGAGDGVWYWQVRAKDAAGNYSPWSTIWNMTIDSIAPGVPSHVSPADGAFKTTANQTIIDWSDISDASTVTYRYQSSLNAATNPDGSFASPAYTSGVLSVSEIPTPSTPEGVYYWHVKAVDGAGHESAWSSSWSVIVDNTAPSLPVPSLPSGDYTGLQTVELSSGDSLSGLKDIYYTTDGSTPDNNSTVYSGAIAISQDTTLKAIAYDNSGNTSSVMTADYGIAPVISGEGSIGVTTTSITLVWDTDHPATSRVLYDTVSHSGLGPAPNYGYAFSTVEDSNKVTSHSVTINGLTPGVTYYFRTVSHGSPESVSNEIVAITKVAPSSNTSTSGGSGASSTPVFRIVTANGSIGQPIVAGAVLAATTSDDTPATTGSEDDSNANDDNAGTSEVKAASTEKDDGISNWLWLLLLLLAISAFAYYQYRRHDKDNTAQ